ncbi:MAG TPA: condensation domain-containing protein, partial [Rugosimonospora sp.]|nr:condensation domain-containing protein [Rugosimonospora sp.]
MRRPPLVATGHTTGVPLSYAQEGLWFLQQLDTGDAAYTVPLVLRLAPDVDRVRLEQALTALVERHEMLRTRIAADASGAPRQGTGEVFTPEVVWHDGIGHADWNRVMAQALRRPFDLPAGRLVHGAGARLADGTQRLVLAVHHIAADGWSLRLLARDLVELYRGGTPAPLPVRYTDFAVWQRDWLRGDTLAAELAYWRGELAGAAPLDLPTDRPRPERADTAAGSVVAAIPPEPTARLLAVGRQERATGFIVATAVMTALLGKWSGQTDMVIGSVQAGRGTPQVAELVGNFVNTMALRVNLRGDPSFRELLRRVRASVLGALRHQDTPFDRVVAEVVRHRDLSRHPLFSVALLHQDFPADQAGDGPIELELRETAAAVSTRFDVELHTVLQSGHLSTLVLYRRDLFEERTMTAMARRLVLLGERMAAQPDAPLSSLSLLTEAESRRLTGWNVTARPMLARTVAELVATQAALRPEVTAVAAPGATLTYAELDERSAKRAADLSARGVRPGDVVGVGDTWDADTIIEALAVLRCGAAYRMGLSGTETGARHLAAVVPTPDGAVAVTQRNLVRLAEGARDALDDDTTVLVLDTGPLAPWPVLCAGRTCLLAAGPDPVTNLARLAPHTTVLTAEQLADVVDTDARVLAPLDEIVVSGDPRAFAQFPPGLAAYWSYQRPETSGVCAVHIGPHGGRALIGRPAPNVRLYVLDASLRPVPPGMRGELYVGGDGVADGYLGDPGGTARRFLPDPYGLPGERMFRTGERVRLLDSGAVEWCGRCDGQVTVHGQRVDPAAVERVLAADPRVRRAVVVARVADGRTGLVGYVDAEPDALAAIGASTAGAHGLALV